MQAPGTTKLGEARLPSKTCVLVKLTQLDRSVHAVPAHVER